MRRTVCNAKRTLDLVGATVGLLMLAPLVPLVALAIKLDSPGPVFFGQRRVGIDRRSEWGPAKAGVERRRRADLGGAVFQMVKFRTMREDAESVSGPAWTSDNDPRITRVGAFLRKSKIDELPQLWNVLRGEMSLVGPRPETPHFVEKLTSELPVYRERVTGVKPGITGLAQVHCEDDGSFFGSLREKIYYDLLYGANLARARHWWEPLVLDVGIMLKTLGHLFEFHKTFDRDTVRVELPQKFWHVETSPETLAEFTPYGARREVLRNPDKITVWWYLRRARKQSPPAHGDRQGLQVLKILSDELTYVCNREGLGGNALILVKHLEPPSASAMDRVIRASRSTLRREFTDTIKLEAPSKVHAIAVVEEFLEAVWQDLAPRSTDPHFGMHMGVMLLEAITNVVKHAHQDTPESRIPIEMTVANERLTLKVLDYGPGFDLETTASQAMPDWLDAQSAPALESADSNA